MTQADAPEWPAALARGIAAEVRRYRKARGMSAQRLSDRCNELGLRIERSVLANLEGGRRTTVTVAELLVLAAALDVAPALLVFPVGHNRETEVLPGREVNTWTAAQWFFGTGVTAEAVGLPEGPWESAILQYTEHDRLVRVHGDAMRELTYLRKRAETENGNIAGLIRSGESLVDSTERNLLALREQIARDGLLLPDLPPGIAARVGGSG